MFHGKPKVELNANGMLEPTANAAQETLIEENIAPLTFLPVVALRVHYNFPIKWGAERVET